MTEPLLPPVTPDLPAKAPAPLAPPPKPWRVEEAFSRVDALANDISPGDRLRLAIDVSQEERAWREFERERKAAIRHDRRSHLIEQQRAQAERKHRRSLYALTVLTLILAAFIGWRIADRTSHSGAGIGLEPTSSPTATVAPSLTPTEDGTRWAFAFAKNGLAVLLLVGFGICLTVAWMRLREAKREISANRSDAAAKTAEGAHSALVIAKVLAALTAIGALGQGAAFFAPPALGMLPWWRAGLQPRTPAAKSPIAGRVLMTLAAFAAGCLIVLIAVWPRDISPSLSGSHWSPGWKWIGTNCSKIAGRYGGSQWATAAVAFLGYVLAIIAPGIALDVPGSSGKPSA